MNLIRLDRSTLLRKYLDETVARLEGCDQDGVFEELQRANLDVRDREHDARGAAFALKEAQQRSTFFEGELHDAKAYRHVLVLELDLRRYMREHPGVSREEAGRAWVRHEMKLKRPVR